MSKKIPQHPESYWRDSTNAITSKQLEKDIKADVGIVGGGITGITAAYLLSKKGKKVVLLDAGPLFNGTTGHTTAKITAQHGIVYDSFIQQLGVEKAEQYYKANKQAMEFIKETIDQEGIDCEYTVDDAYIYTDSDKKIQKLEQEKEAYDKLGIIGELLDEIPLNIPIKKALKMENQAHFHPLKYLNHLVQIIQQNGGEIYENTTAIDVEYSDHQHIITRNGHRVVCDHVIVASHFPFIDGEGFYFTRMYPSRSYLMAFEPEKSFPGGMYINAGQPSRTIRYVNIDGKDALLVGGEKHKTGQGKPEIEHYEAIEKFAQDTFGIKNYLYRWSAQDLTTLDKVPYIGPITSDQPELLLATGYRKWGMTNGTAAALLLTDFILGEKNPYAEVFDPSRFHAQPDIKKFAEINADVAKHLLKGKLEFTGKSIEDLKEDEGQIIRIKGKRTGAYKDEQGKVHLVDTTCTHLGCEVNWNSGDRTWDCPCHGSRFSVKGEVIEGPAQKPLTKYN
ncbi:FAD-dependent oxidoreductase [Radiobacillus kanasensis]|uniref:FAD-dependent oxidoreductase n=1 Tax=Radiobacillus kanasensis TaxID=2844358 RepID=UPI001E4DDB43|nr:FAD-dependent oxidoreductase [Radiobacillus kanasensis]UFU01229.1 FAD-dependent oxidoreductase [Radiobacillus kanasensis]